MQDLLAVGHGVTQCIQGLSAQREGELPHPWSREGLVATERPLALYPPVVALWWRAKWLAVVPWSGVGYRG